MHRGVTRISPPMLFAGLAGLLLATLVSICLGALFISKCSAGSSTEKTPSQSISLKLIHVQPPRPADHFGYPIGDGTFKSPCKDGDGYFVARRFLTTFQCEGHSDNIDSHLGEDWNGESGGNTDLGEKIMAVANGTVVYSDIPGPCWGPVVILRHRSPQGKSFQLPDGKRVREIWSLYAHFQEISVQAGDSVAKGSPLGKMGANCCSCYAHLHFEIIVDSSGPFPGQGYYSKEICSARDCGRVAPSAFLDLNKDVRAEDKKSL
jgi:hypothetical protein